MAEGLEGDRWLNAFFILSGIIVFALFLSSCGGGQAWGPMNETDKNDLACNEYGFYAGSRQYDDCVNTLSDAPTLNFCSSRQLCVKGYWRDVASDLLFIGGVLSFARVQPESSLARACSRCAQANTGASRIRKNCIFDLFEACRRTVISGNRGFCTRNPAYVPR